MADWTVLITHGIPDAGIRLLKQSGFRIVTTDTVSGSGKSNLKDSVGKADAILCLLTDTIDSAVIDSASNLKIIANYAVGFNNIDVTACTQRGIAVTNTPGVLTEATADMAMALMLAVAKRIVEADAFIRKGLFRGWDPMLFPGADLNGRTLGIIGAGRIGKAVARRAFGFEMRILYTDPKKIPDIESKFNATRVDLEDLLHSSDFVTLHVPLDDTTHHLIDAHRLAMMKSGAILINTSRGPVVDEQALLEALKQKHLGGAGLDVYEMEPELTPGLTDLPNTVLLPHIASATVETRNKMARMAAENIIAISKNMRPPNLVNPEIYDRG
jgi:glyoxylate reductase